MKLLTIIMDEAGQWSLAAIHAVQQKPNYSCTVVRQKLTQRTMIGGLVRVVAPKRLRFGKKSLHIFDLVWSELPATEIVAGNFRTACIMRIVRMIAFKKGRGYSPVGAYTRRLART